MSTSSILEPIKVKFASTLAEIKTSSERLINNAGAFLPFQLLKRVDFDHRVDVFTGPFKQYPNSDILKPMILSILSADPNFNTIDDFRENEDFYVEAMGLHENKLPSEATVRQRMDDIGDSLNNIFDRINVDLLLSTKAVISPSKCGMVPVDTDVTPCINERCKKEGASVTYKRKLGFAPILSYIGAEGYPLAVEFREGKQHCQKNTPEFLRQCITAARELTDLPLLFRLDSGNDAAENIGLFMEAQVTQKKNVFFIIKRNPRVSNAGMSWYENIHQCCLNQTKVREGKERLVGSDWIAVTYDIYDEYQDRMIKETRNIRCVYDVTYRTIDKNGNHLLIPEYEVDLYWTNTALSDEQVIEEYHAHGESEQYHSEIKTDMNAELFASEKFATNSLILHLTVLCYNILRILGQASLEEGTTSNKRAIFRRRVGTIIQYIICAPAIFTRHSRQYAVDFGRGSTWKKCLLGLTRRYAIAA